MKIKIIFIVFIAASLQGIAPVYDWIIVGAGPAGIITAAVLLDLGVDRHNIVMVDPEFKVGRLGEKYGTIPANTKTKLFIEFLNACTLFRQCNSPAIQELYTHDPEKECTLQIIIDPLQDISDELCKLVNIRRGYIQSLDFINDDWSVVVAGEQFMARHVVLATGSHPRSLEYQCDTEIPLDVALNKELLAEVLKDQDTVAVVGGAHSAVLVMKFLSELSATRILNLYQRPLVFPVDNGTWIENLYEGLKGAAAQWAHDNLEGRWPDNLLRVINTNGSRKAWLPICNKIVYAVGYDRNQVPSVNGSSEIAYDSLTGKIGTRLFGIGIAFPETHTYPSGISTPRIGLNSFMEYAQKVIPQWLISKSDCVRARLRAYEDLFTIDVL